MELPTTFVIEMIFAPCFLACFKAFSVSAVSPDWLTAIINEFLLILITPEVPGEEILKGQYAYFRFWDYIEEYLIDQEGIMAPPPILVEFLVAWLKCHNNKLLSQYLGAQVNCIEIPKQNVLYGIKQMFLFRYLELGFEAIKDQEEKRKNG